MIQGFHPIQPGVKCGVWEERLDTQFIANRARESDASDLSIGHWVQIEGKGKIPDGHIEQEQ